MSCSPRVTVGLPVYNGETFIESAIESLLSQTFSDFELVISDNASTDATPDICRKYQQLDSRVCLEIQPENRGAAWNFNRVYHLARGEYFRWASDDDLCEAEYLERCVDMLDGDSSLVWCHCRTTHIDESGQAFAAKHLQDASNCCSAECLSGPCRGTGVRKRRSTTFCRTSRSPRDRFGGVILGKNNLDVFGLIRSSALAKTQLQRPYYGADNVLLAELSLLGRYQEAPETLFYKRIHSRASGALTNHAQLQQWIDPTRKSRSSIHTRLQLLRGYLGMIAKSNLDRRERFRCYVVVLRYLFQTHKWKRVIAKTLSCQGTGGGYLATLNELSQVRGGGEGSA